MSSYASRNLGAQGIGSTPVEVFWANSTTISSEALACQWWLFLRAANKFSSVVFAVLSFKCLKEMLLQK